MFSYIVRLEKAFLNVPGGVAAGERTDHGGMKPLKSQHIHPSLIGLMVIVKRALCANWPLIGFQAAMVDHPRMNTKAGTKKR
jgi:hypothetical protein